MGVFSIATWMPILSDHSRCEREGPLCHLQGEVRTLPNKTQLFPRYHNSHSKQNYANGCKTTIPTHNAPDMTPTRCTQLHPCGKTTHLSGKGRRHQDHMVTVLIRSWGRSTRQAMAPRPPSGPLRYQLCHMGQLLAGEPLAGVHFVSRAAREKGRPGHVWCAPTVLLCNHVIKQKVLMTERCKVVFLL